MKHLTATSIAFLLWTTTIYSFIIPSPYTGGVTSLICSNPLHSTPPLRSTLFNTDILRVTSRNTTTAPYTALSMLHQMNKLYTTGHVTAKPTLETYLLVIKSFIPIAKKRDDVLGIVQNLHEEMKADTNNYGIEVSIESYNLVMKVMALSCGRKGGSVGRALCQEVVDMLSEMSEKGISPDRNSYECVIESWARCSRDGDPYCAEKANEWLMTMERLHETNEGEEDFSPSTRVYNLVIDAYNRSGRKGTGVKAAAVLSRVPDPNDGSYITAILALSRTASERNVAHQAMSLLHSYVEYCQTHDKVIASIIPFNAVITAWGKMNNRRNNQASQNARRVLNLMYELNRQQPLVFGQVQPEALTYNAVMHATKNPLHVESILKQMQSHSIAPDAYTYTILTAVHAQNGNPEMAESYLREMQSLYDNGQNIDIKPTIKNYGMVINSYVKKGDAISAEALLSTMEKLYYEKDDIGLKPDVISYTNIMEAHAKKGKPEKALVLFNKLMSQYNKSPDGDEEMAPNVRTFTALILAHSKSHQPGSAAAARAVLDDMKTFAQEMKRRRRVAATNNAPVASNTAVVAPNSFSYNYVLSACANEPLDNMTPERQKNTLSILLQTYKEMRRGGAESGDKILRPDSFTYAFFFKAVVNLIPKGDTRDRIMKTVFAACCEEGMVNEEVMFRFRRGEIGGDAAKSLRDVSIGDLPKRWKCNATR